MRDGGGEEEREGVRLNGLVEGGVSSIMSECVC